MPQFDRHSQSNMGSRGMGSDTPAAVGNPLAVVQVAANSVLRSNIELLGLANRRAHAQMNMVRQMVACKSPADVTSVTTQFWQAALRDYGTIGSRVMGFWLETYMPAGQRGPDRETAQPDGRPATGQHATTSNGALSDVSDDLAEPWAWWRTDVKGLKANRHAQGHDLSASQRQSH